MCLVLGDPSEMVVVIVTPTKKGTLKQWVSPSTPPPKKKKKKDSKNRTEQKTQVITLTQRQAQPTPSPLHPFRFALFSGCPAGGRFESKAVRRKRCSSSGDAAARTWPIVPPVNIRFNPTTRPKWVANSATPSWDHWF